MPTITENRANHPEWYVDPAQVSPEAMTYLAWLSEQPNSVGPGTIGDAWEQGGTGPFYKPHVVSAQAAIDKQNRVVRECHAMGQEAPSAPWERWAPGVKATPATTGVSASEGGAAFGGS
jgi:hypothetical protein